MNRSSYLDKEVVIANGPHQGCSGKVVGVFAEKSGLENDLRVLITNNFNKKLGGKVKYCYFKMDQIRVAEEVNLYCWQHKTSKHFKWTEYDSLTSDKEFVQTSLDKWKRVPKYDNQMVVLR
jgi:hypothetical protein